MPYIDSSLFQQAVELRKKRHFKDAIDLLKQHLRNHKNDVKALNELGKCFSALKDFPNAKIAFEKILQKNPQDVFALNELGRVYRFSGDFDNAIIQFKKLLSIQKDNVLGLNELGITYRVSGDFDSAIFQFEKILKIKNGNDVSALNELGITYREQGDFDNAIFQFEKILKIKNGNDVSALNELGITYREQGDFDNAIFQFKKLLSIQKDNVLGLNELGITYRVSGDFDSAILQFKKRLDIEKDDVRSLNELGITYRVSGDFELAIPLFQKAIEKGNIASLNELGITYFELNDYKKAQNYFEQILEKNNKDYMAYSWLGHLARRRGDKTQAIKFYHNSLEFDAQNHHNLENIAKLYEQNKQRNLAEIYYEEAMKLDEDNQQLKARVQQLEQERKQQTAQLMEIYRLNDANRTSIGLAHEINNPLNNIQIIVDNLLDEELPDNIKKELHQVQENADRINRLIEHQKRIVQKRETATIPINLKEVITKSFENFQQRLSIHKIRYNIQQLPDNLPLIQADAIDLYSIFSNLITNAQEALKNTQLPQIVLDIQQTPQTLILTFSDNGKGIEKAYLTKIFEPLATTKNEQGGLGLGLWTCKNALEKIGASIQVKSEINQGTTFILTFPLKTEKKS